MHALWLGIELKSDATPGRGDGVAGMLDAEIQHDANGLPFVGGRALKGMLGSECSDLIFALEQGLSAEQALWWRRVELRLFGESGSALQGEARLRLGPARLPEDLRQAIQADVRDGKLSAVEVLELLTDIRRQTAMDPTGAPKRETLRLARVLLSGLNLIAPITLDSDAPELQDDLALLAAGVKALRHIGAGRNRGRGRIQAVLLDQQGQDMTDTYFEVFAQAVTK